MTWSIEFYKGVDDDIVAMPTKIRARMFSLLKTMEIYGANLGEPHTKSLGNGLFEVRAKAQEGIGRAFYCYKQGKRIIVVHAFVKKTQKTPKKELEIALKRIDEVKK